MLDHSIEWSFYLPYIIDSISLCIKKGIFFYLFVLEFFIARGVFTFIAITKCV